MLEEDMDGKVEPAVPKGMQVFKTAETVFESKYPEAIGDSTMNVSVFRFNNRS